MQGGIIRFSLAAGPVRQWTWVVRPWLFILALCLAAACFGTTDAGAREVKMHLADGFDFPVGKPDAAGYYRARGLRLRSPRHFGDDWNGRGGGDSDLGDPVYSIADGVVTFAHDVRGGWGNVVLVRYGYRDPKDGNVRFIDALYGHLHRMMAKTGDKVKRGQQIGTIGSNRGMYAAHLHFEIRHNISIGMGRNSVPPTLEHWADPTAFINQHRRLKREWRQVAVPTGTYLPYKGFRGL